MQVTQGLAICRDGDSFRVGRDITLEFLFMECEDQLRWYDLLFNCNSMAYIYILKTRKPNKDRDNAW